MYVKQLKAYVHSGAVERDKLGSQVHYYGQLIDIGVECTHAVEMEYTKQMKDVENKNASKAIKKTGRCLYIKDIWTSIMTVMYE